MAPKEDGGKKLVGLLKEKSKGRFLGK